LRGHADVFSFSRRRADRTATAGAQQLLRKCAIGFKETLKRQSPSAAEHRKGIFISKPAAKSTPSIVRSPSLAKFRIGNVKIPPQKNSSCPGDVRKTFASIPGPPFHFTRRGAQVPPDPNPVPAFFACPENSSLASLHRSPVTRSPGVPRPPYALLPPLGRRHLSHPSLVATPTLGAGAKQLLVARRTPLRCGRTTGPTRTPPQDGSHRQAAPFVTLRKSDRFPFLLFPRNFAKRHYFLDQQIDLPRPRRGRP